VRATPAHGVRAGGDFGTASLAVMSHTATCDLDALHDDLHESPHGGAQPSHGHTHGLVDPSILRSRAGLRVVAGSLCILGVTAAVQVAIYVATNSVALLADLIHNGGDALTALPLGAAFLLRSATAERRAGLAVVLTILLSALGAGAFAVLRIIQPAAPTHLLALALAGGAGVLGNAVAARVRLRGGRRLDSAALIADGNHARSDAIVSAGVALSALLVAIGAPVADPILGLVITALILRITWQSWNTVAGAHTAAGSAESDRAGAALAERADGTAGTASSVHLRP
jgi:Co/Zn/Cd efflux system component